MKIFESIYISLNTPINEDIYNFLKPYYIYFKICLFQKIYLLKIIIIKEI